jgi:farnesyl-diphosphate farnesyltransferase
MLEEGAWLRAMLPRVSRTFALNIRVLPEPMLGAVRIAYLLCRAADALEDAWPGSAPGLARAFARLEAALDGDAAAATALAADANGLASGRDDLGLVARLPVLLRALDALPEGCAERIRPTVRYMAAGMARYAVRERTRSPECPYLEDEAELRDYCHVVAGCVGEMLTRLHACTHALPEHGAAFERILALAPVVGEALQLTNIVLDLPEDLRGGRCHVPAAWLARLGIGPGALARPGEPAARELALRLGGLAHAALDRVPEYLAQIPRAHWRYRVFCLWPAVWARESLRLALTTPGFPAGARPRLPRTALWTSAVRGVLVAADDRAVRRLLRAPAAA